MPENPVEHLGDGAYISYDGSAFFVTANHHDLSEATDVVVIDRVAMVHLVAFVEKVKTIERNNDADG